jgi:hypothetical protein
MKLKPAVAGCVLALCSASPAFGQPATATADSAALEAHVGAPVPAPKGVQPGSAEEAKRYAAREEASPEARNFRGGDVIVISATAVAIILLVVIILILL